MVDVRRWTEGRGVIRNWNFAVRRSVPAVFTKLIDSLVKFDAALDRDDVNAVVRQRMTFSSA